MAVSRAFGSETPPHFRLQVCRVQDFGTVLGDDDPLPWDRGQAPQLSRELTSQGENSDENVHGRIPTVSKERIKFRFSLHGALELTVINYLVLPFPFDLPKGMCSKYTEIAEDPLDPDPVQGSGRQQSNKCNQHF